MDRSTEQMLWREAVANKPKHWVRAVTACNSRCLFCLDSDTPRNLYLDVAEIRAEIDRGLDELGAEKIIISGGEASLHPAFVDLVGYAKERGYERVQTVTNGFRFAEKAFYDACIEAGLGEITFSLHGHDAALHDRLTQTPGAFQHLMKGLLRAVRDPRRPIVNVDVVINQQNVAVIDKIVELCIAAGVTEFDLLHVIPQAAAFDHRDELFYDVREHLPVLHRVFRLNRHPRFVVWTNRFPISYLEGLEDLIQDPHKMLDEVNGRRFQMRRYLDEGTALDCRDPARCPHCFIEPFCTTADRVIERQHDDAFDVWDVGREAWDRELPHGCTWLGLEVDDVAELTARAPDAGKLYVRMTAPDLLPLALASRVMLVARTAAQLRAWVPSDAHLVVHLNRDTAPWLLAHRAELELALERVRIEQPSYEHMRDAAANDVRDPHAFFTALGLPVSVSGLPACLTPSATWSAGLAILPLSLFDAESGRLAIRPLARHHITDHYRAKSVRCDDCRLTDRCDGAHVNMIRDQGLAILRPLGDGDPMVAQLAALAPFARLATGRPALSAAASLPGFAGPRPAPPDPLAVAGRERDARRALKRSLPVLGGE